MRTNQVDAMGYKEAADIPNYWAYAKNFVLQDRLFQPNSSWNLPQHLFMVSEWSARCTEIGEPMSCTNEVQSPARPAQFMKYVTNPNFSRAGSIRSTSGPISPTSCTGRT